MLEIRMELTSDTVCREIEVREPGEARKVTEGWSGNVGTREVEISDTPCCITFNALETARRGLCLRPGVIGATVDWVLRIQEVLQLTEHLLVTMPKNHLCCCAKLNQRQLVRIKQEMYSVIIQTGAILMISAWQKALRIWSKTAMEDKETSDFCLQLVQQLYWFPSLWTKEHSSPKLCGQIWDFTIMKVSLGPRQPIT